MWKIGELARRTGLTVRTLHHYDAIRLLSPEERSDGGHRVYGEADVRRLYRIVSLRSLGFPLDAIAAPLEREWAEIFATLRAEMDAGTDPADPRLPPLAERGRELVAMFTGGDPGIASSLKQMWENEDPEKVSHGMVDAEVWSYYGEVQAAIG